MSILHKFVLLMQVNNGELLSFLARLEDGLRVQVYKITTELGGSLIESKLINNEQLKER